MIHEKLVKKYCKEDISKIENYDKAIADTTQTWDCHHRTEIWWNCSAKDLIENECYYNRKACELIFLTPSEHHRLHNHGENNPLFGKHHSDETRRKMYESLKGHTVNEETRRKMREAKKGKPSIWKGKHPTEESRRKMSEAAKRRWARKLDDAC